MWTIHGCNWHNWYLIAQWHYLTIQSGNVTAVMSHLISRLSYTSWDVKVKWDPSGSTLWATVDTWWYNIAAAFSKIVIMSSSNINAARHAVNAPTIGFFYVANIHNYTYIHENIKRNKTLGHHLSLYIYSTYIYIHSKCSTAYDYTSVCAIFIRGPSGTRLSLPVDRSPLPSLISALHCVGLVMSPHWHAVSSTQYMFPLSSVRLMQKETSNFVVFKDREFLNLPACVHDENISKMTL